MTSPYYLLFLLLASIVLIIWLTAYKKINAFFALLMAALVVGLCSGLPLADIVNALKAGFGHTMEKVGLLILLGTTLGLILQKTGATRSMANAILRIVKEENAPLAIAITGFVIGFPIFCDSGFVILSGLNQSLTQKSGSRKAVMATALATSLYAVHCLVPPHPGITAAVGTVNGNLGNVMLWGIALALPAALIGYVWSLWRGNKEKDEKIEENKKETEQKEAPSAILSFVPVVVPIVLIAIKSVLSIEANKTDVQNRLSNIISFVGEPVVALMVGVVLSLFLISAENKKQWTHWLTESVEKAGMILAIIAGGGMFGEMLGAAGIGKHLGELLGTTSLGIFFPFLVTAVLKTAQGSSTVAIITASSLLTPLLPQLGLQSSFATTMAILSMGAGSMVISHANDAYFWVISRFAQLPTAVTLRVYSTATFMMGITVQIVIWLLYSLLK